MRIAGLLRAWRYREAMSVRQAAERIGIPWSTYGRIENGYPMSGDTFAVILRGCWKTETPCYHQSRHGLY